MHKPRFNTKDPVILDGRTLEGGGQLLRNALCLSALTEIPIKVHDIRGSRSGGGGLKAQHLACVQWLAYACNARTDGAEKGSKNLLFAPGKALDDVGHLGHSRAFKKRMKDDQAFYDCKLEIGTAGSTGLALQAILPFILYSRLPSKIPVKLKLSGGTNVSGSPSYEYITQVLLPTLHKIGFPEMKATLNKRGWSHGGSSIGNFEIEIPARESLLLPAFSLTTDSDSSMGQPQSKVTHVRATFIAPSSCHVHFRSVLVPTLQKTFADLCVPEQVGVDVATEASRNDKRMYLILVATVQVDSPARNPEQPDSAKTCLLAQDWLYDRKIRSRDTAATEMVEKVTRKLVEEVRSGAFVDEHMRDQLVIFQALAQGRSTVWPGVDENEAPRKASLHTQTAQWVAAEMLGVKFRGERRCDGIGFEGRDEHTELEGAEHGEVNLEERLRELEIS